MHDFDKFERNFDRAWNVSLVIILVTALLSLAVAGVAIWAIIALVLHFT